jgi:hypothetical protein
MKIFLKIVGVYVGAFFFFFLAQRACVAYIWLLFKYACILNTGRHIRIQFTDQWEPIYFKIWRLLLPELVYVRLVRLYFLVFRQDWKHCLYNVSIVFNPTLKLRYPFTVFIIDLIFMRSKFWIIHISNIFLFIKNKN